MLEQVFRPGAAGLGNLVENVEELRFRPALAAQPVAPLEPRPRQGQHVLRDLLNGAAADLRLQSEPRHRLAHDLAIGGAPAPDQLIAGIETLIVVKNARPQGRKRAEPPPLPGIGPAHLEIALEPDLREYRREMVAPVLEGWPLAGQLRQLARHELAKTFARAVDVAPISCHEIHRHIERIVDIALEAESRLEG